MVKYIIILLILLSSCTQYTAVTSIKSEYSLILNNNILNIDLYEIGRDVYLKNTGNQLIVEIDYNINDENMIIYNVLVPNQKVFIYTWPGKMNYDVIITLNAVGLY